MTRCTYRLTERVTVECRLTVADVEVLLAEHRAHLRLAPAGAPGCYRLTPTGHVGVIVAPSCRLVIRPKVPLVNLFHLLDPTGPLPSVTDATTPESGTEVLDFLAGQLARLLGERAAAGLHRAYAERREVGPYLHGQLDVAAQLRGPPVRKDVVHSRFDDFTADVPCNQIPKATSELVLISPLLGDTARAALRGALAAFAEIRPIALAPESFAAAEPDRRTEAYRPLLDLCRLLAEQLAPGRVAGPTRCPAFLLDMERVFEQYVTRGMVEACAHRPDDTVRVQPLFSAGTGGDIPMRPDVILTRHGEARTILDAKWKRKPRCPLRTDDLYQVIAYATALGLDRAMLVYPGRRDRAWRYTLARTPLTIDVRALRVVGSRAACTRSLRRLGRAGLR